MYQRKQSAVEVAGTRRTGVPACHIIARIGVSACLSLLMLTAGAGWAYDPPRIIGILSPAGDYRNGFAYDFCAIAGQNGHDDLLVADGSTDPIVEIHVFQGTDTLPDEPVFAFRPYTDNQILESIAFGGWILGEDRTPMIIISSLVDEPIRSRRIDLFKDTTNFTYNPFTTITIAERGNDPRLSYGYRAYPTDFNGDGYDDVVIARYNFGIQVYFGGNQIDTLADWEYEIEQPSWSGGLDINGDGFDDILVWDFNNPNNFESYRLFLGGNPPDTIPAYIIDVQDYNLEQEFTMLPDINGDGYDEWGAYWDKSNPMDDGFLIFLGSAEPDSIPDLRLAGTRGQWVGRGGLTGGDFNGDSFGDIAIYTGGTDEIHGQTSALALHFGNRWITDVGDREKQPDLYIDLGREYGGQYAWEFGGILGAPGDYNGDSVDDFVLHGYEYDKVLVMAGDRGWRADAPKEVEPARDFKIDASVSPNPFNSRLNIFVSTGSAARPTRVEVFDVTGRMVEELTIGRMPAPHEGEYRFVWEAPSAGIYLVAVRTEDGVRAVGKAVCLR